MGQLNFPTVDILAVCEDDYGLCAKARVQLRGISTLVRWGIDEFTYQNLRDCLESHVSRYEPSVPVLQEDGDGALCFRLTALGRPFDQDIYTNEAVHISEDRFVTQGFFLDDYQDASFSCSTHFASNLVWLSEIKRATDLDSVRWDNVNRELPVLSDDLTNREPPAIVDDSTDIPPEEEDARQLTVSEPELPHLTVVNRSDSQPPHVRRVRKTFGQYAITIAAILIVASGGYAVLRDRLANHVVVGTSGPHNALMADSDVLNAAHTSTDTSGNSSANSPSANVPLRQEYSQNAVNSSAQSGITGNTVATSAVSGSTNYVSLSDSQGTSPTTKECQSSASHAHEVWDVPKGEVALTFDDGPTPLTSEFVKVLNHYGVHATFFFVGQKVQYWPDSVKLAAASGDVIGDHSMTHADLTGLDFSGEAAQIIGDKTLLEKLINQKVTWFRPPYGAYDESTEDILVSNGMGLALWNRDPRDWAAKTPEEVVQAVLGTQPSGGLYDMHETPATLAALPTIIEKLKAMNLKIVTLPASSPRTKT